jgi:cell division transport system permease protein
VRTLAYSVSTALKNLWLERWINFLTVISISVGLLILSSFVTITLNVDSVMKRWSTGFGMVVYLKDNITGEEKESLRRLLSEDSGIVEVNYISNTEALESLRNVLGSGASILEDISENPLPSSFELKLKRDLVTTSYVKKKAKEIRGVTGVDDVQYGEEWLSSLNTLSSLLGVIAVFLGGAIFIAITFITYTTIKILFYRRTEEIDTMKLLGATRSFIKLPFLLEGLFIGLLSGIISALALLLIQSVTTANLIEFIPSLKPLVVSLPVEAYLFLPLAGAALSLTGSFFATGRIRY